MQKVYFNHLNISPGDGFNFLTSETTKHTPFESLETEDNIRKIKANNIISALKQNKKLIKRLNGETCEGKDLVRCAIIKDKSELYQFISMNIRTSLHFMLNENHPGEMGRFLEMTTFSDKNLSLFIHLTSKKFDWYFDTNNIYFSPEIFNDNREFINLYGDSYIKSLCFGGEMLIKIDFLLHTYRCNASSIVNTVKKIINANADRYRILVSDSMKSLDESPSVNLNFGHFLITPSINISSINFHNKSLFFKNLSNIFESFFKYTNNHPSLIYGYIKFYNQLKEDLPVSDFFSSDLPKFPSEITEEFLNKFYHIHQRHSEITNYINSNFNKKMINSSDKTLFNAKKDKEEIQKTVLSPIYEKLMDNSLREYLPSSDIQIDIDEKIPNLLSYVPTYNNINKETEVTNGDDKIEVLSGDDEENVRQIEKEEKEETSESMKIQHIYYSSEYQGILKLFLILEKNFAIEKGENYHWPIFKNEKSNAILPQICLYIVENEEDRPIVKTGKKGPGYYLFVPGKHPFSLLKYLEPFIQMNQINCSILVVEVDEKVYTNIGVLRKYMKEKDTKSRNASLGGQEIILIPKIESEKKILEIILSKMKGIVKPGAKVKDVEDLTKKLEKWGELLTRHENRITRLDRLANELKVPLNKLGFTFDKIILNEPQDLDDFTRYVNEVCEQKEKDLTKKLVRTNEYATKSIKQIEEKGKEILKEIVKSKSSLIKKIDVLSGAMKELDNTIDLMCLTIPAMMGYRNENVDDKIVMKTVMKVEFVFDPRSEFVHISIQPLIYDQNIFQKVQESRVYAKNKLQLKTNDDSKMDILKYLIYYDMMNK